MLRLPKEFHNNYQQSQASKQLDIMCLCLQDIVCVDLAFFDGEEARSFLSSDDDHQALIRS